MNKRVTALGVIASMLAMPCALAQEHDQHEHAAALGDVNFPVSCNAEAQAHFNTAAALLYSFYGELRQAMVAQKKDYWIEQADIQIDTLNAWIARAEGRNEEAVKLMSAAADREDKTEEHIMMPGRVIPVREMLGELLLDLKQPQAALAAFEESLRNDPNRFRNVYGAARAAELAGHRDKARTYYAKLLRQIGPHAAGRAEISHARAFVAKL